MYGIINVMAHAIIIMATLVAGFSGRLLAASAQPNIIVILSDDQGWGDLSISGNTNLSTPNIDALATEGARFDRFYVSPVCSPTRAEFLTGRFHLRSGIAGTSAGTELMGLDEHTIAETFQDAGYTTGVFGKWHNGSQYPYHPTGRGFDTFYGLPTGHWGQYFDWFLERNGAMERFDGFVIDAITDNAMQFIDDNQSRPFFCYIPYNTPHSPMQVPDKYYEKFEDNPLPMRHRDKKENMLHARAALAMCENIDWNVGRVTDQLERLGIAEQTIIMYFSDNGPNGARWNDDMKGRKGSTDEGGVRSPFMIRWPGKIPAGTVVRELSGAIDLLPTLVDLAGINHTGTKPLDGISVAPLMKQTAQQWPDRLYFSHWSGRVTVRSRQYRLDNNGQLFDMYADPGQRNDVAKEHPGVASRLSAAQAEWRKQMRVGEKPEARPFPVGYTEYPTTWLPSRDGIEHGEIKRSNRFPNDSFFHNWVRQQDTITWDIAVENDGAYEAIVYYTCPASDVGSTVALEFQGSSIQGRVNQAFDPPDVGAEDDRVGRQESYVKLFDELPLGTMQLKRGRGQLTLRALDMPGKQIMDVRAIRLRLLP